MSLLPVAEALALMLDRARPLDEDETVPLDAAAGRILAVDLVATQDQPPFPASAMDGYAVRAADLPGALALVGTSAAGSAFAGRVGPGECVRIFTGAIVPDGADSVLIQEDARAEDGRISGQGSLEPGRYVRPQGLDYAKAETLLAAGHVMTPAALALAASTGLAGITVRRRPRVAIVMTGDELVEPGSERAEGEIYASNGTGVAAIVERAGGEALPRGIAPDALDALVAALDVPEADIVVTLGGASVGDHDLVRPALERLGVEMAFMKLAMRPGKPVMFGTKGRQLFLGLPGNPVSSLVGAEVLLVPLVRSLLGRKPDDLTTREKLAMDLPANGPRQHYMRASLTPDGVVPFANQDSSLLATLARADVLLVREAGEGPRKAGESVPIMRF